MKLSRALGLAAIIPGLVLSGASLAGATRAKDQSMGASDEKKCQVTVDRRQEYDGTYDVTRQVLENGDCICYVYTGPLRQSDTIEKAIAALQESGDCRDAKVAAVIPGGAAVAGGAAGGAAAVGGALGVGTVAPFVAVAAAGAGVAASGGDDDSSGG